ncbi:hypothetical protein ACFRFL_24655 [Streptomyces sp. NPDC056708]|uniref:hypothetical protein n=1 Tax=unclassified Streptomyces TaxID=2593676 RepID=UPI0036B6030F
MQETGLTHVTPAPDTDGGPPRKPAATTDLLLPAGAPELIATLPANGPPDRPVMVDG